MSDPITSGIGQEARAREVLADVLGFNTAQRQSFLDGNTIPIIFPPDAVEAMIRFAGGRDA